MHTARQFRQQLHVTTHLWHALDVMNTSLMQCASNTDPFVSKCHAVVFESSPEVILYQVYSSRGVLPKIIYLTSLEGLLQVLLFFLIG